MMKLINLRIAIIAVISLCYSFSFAQNIDFDKQSSLGNLYIRMYGEIQFNQPINSKTFQQGQFDATRLVALFGYQFDRKTQFVTEWELEHANEIFLEQAFIKHQIASNTSIKAGMLLIPMGIINENHEPNNFYSVARPLIDRTIVPSTWRDIGIGVTGILPASDLKYQLYLVNGLLGYADGAAKFKAGNNVRSGRQKGIKTVMSGLPALSGQLEYYGFTNGKLGFSFYTGNSNTDAKNGLERSDEIGVLSADSTTVQNTMLGLHAKFSKNNWSLKGQVLYLTNGGVVEYNERGKTDLGKSTLGMYAEGGRSITKDNKWTVFGRYSMIYSNFNNISEKQNEVQHILTTGFNFLPAQGAVFKIDGQWSVRENDNLFQLNAGIGVWF